VLLHQLYAFITKPKCVANVKITFYICCRSIEQVTYKILLGMAVADLLVRINAISQIIVLSVFT